MNTGVRIMNAGVLRVNARVNDGILLVCSLMVHTG